MASGQPTPPQPPAQMQTQQQKPAPNPFVHKVALVVTPVALIALFLPPRRFDARLAILGGVAVWGTNQLVLDYSGTSSLQRVGARVQGAFGSDLPDKAKATQARLRAERERLREAAAAGVPEDQRRLLEEQRRRQQMGGKREGEGEKGLLERVWMGDSDPDWKEKRDRREKEALSEGGGGYWGLITDQIAEVWNGGKKKDDDGGEKQGKDASDGEPKKS